MTCALHPFTEAEARGHVGRLVRTRLGLPGVAPGTVGEVEDVCPGGDGRGWELVVHWRTPRPWILPRGDASLSSVEGTPVRDWIAHVEFSRGIEWVVTHDDVQRVVSHVSAKRPPPTKAARAPRTKRRPWAVPLDPPTVPAEATKDGAR